MYASSGRRRVALPPPPLRAQQSCFCTGRCVSRRNRNISPVIKNASPSSNEMVTLRRSISSWRGVLPPVRLRNLLSRLVALAACCYCCLSSDFDPKSLDISRQCKETSAAHSVFHMQELTELFYEVSPLPSLIKGATAAAPPPMYTTNGGAEGEAPSETSNPLGAAQEAPSAAASASPIADGSSAYKSNVVDDVRHVGTRLRQQGLSSEDWAAQEQQEHRDLKRSDSEEEGQLQKEEGKETQNLAQTQTQTTPVRNDSVKQSHAEATTKKKKRTSFSRLLQKFWKYLFEKNDKPQSQKALQHADGGSEDPETLQQGNEDHAESERSGSSTVKTASPTGRATAHNASLSAVDTVAAASVDGSHVATILSYPAYMRGPARRWEQRARAEGLIKGPRKGRSPAAGNRRHAVLLASSSALKQGPAAVPVASMSAKASEAHNDGVLSSVVPPGASPASGEEVPSAAAAAADSAVMGRRLADAVSRDREGNVGRGERKNMAVKHSSSPSPVRHPQAHATQARVTTTTVERRGNDDLSSQSSRPEHPNKLENMLLSEFARSTRSRRRRRCTENTSDSTRDRSRWGLPSRSYDTSGAAASKEETRKPLWPISSAAKDDTTNQGLHTRDTAGSSPKGGRGGRGEQPGYSYDEYSTSGLGDVARSALSTPVDEESVGTSRRAPKSSFKGIDRGYNNDEEGDATRGEGGAAAAAASERVDGLLHSDVSTPSGLSQQRQASGNVRITTTTPQQTGRVDAWGGLDEFLLNDTSAAKFQKLSSAYASGLNASRKRLDQEYALNYLLGVAREGTAEMQKSRGQDNYGRQQQQQQQNSLPAAPNQDAVRLGEALQATHVVRNRARQQQDSGSLSWHRQQQLQLQQQQLQQQQLQQQQLQQQMQLHGRLGNLYRLGEEQQLQPVVIHPFPLEQRQAGDRSFVEAAVHQEAAAAVEEENGDDMQQLLKKRFIEQPLQTKQRARLVTRIIFNLAYMAWTGFLAVHFFSGCSSWSRAQFWAAAGIALLYFGEPIISALYNIGTSIQVLIQDGILRRERDNVLAVADAVHKIKILEEKAKLARKRRKEKSEEWVDEDDSTREETSTFVRGSDDDEETLTYLLHNNPPQQQ